MNTDLSKVANWFENNLLTLNNDKSKFVLIGSHHKLSSCDEINLFIRDKKIGRCELQ